MAVDTDDFVAFDGCTSGVGDLPELAWHIRHDESSTGDQWLCFAALNSGAVIYVFCVWTDILLILEA